MKNNIIVKLFLLILCIGGIISYTETNALDKCTTTEKNNLIQLAHNIKFDYELSNNTASGEGKRYFKITISNITKDTYVSYDQGIYTYEDNSDTPGIITIGSLFAPNTTYTFKVYAATACPDEILLTKTVNLPSYNIYSEKEECQTYPDFKLCNRYYAGSITDSEFQSKLKQYQESLAKDESERENEKDDNFISMFLSIYLDNLIIAIPITVIVLGLIVFVIIRLLKKRKRIKIDL